MDSFHYTSSGNRLQTHYPYDEPPFNQRNGPHDFYPSFDPATSIERNIRLVLDPEVSYEERTSIVWFLVSNLLADGYHVDGIAPSLARLFLAILALDGMVPGCTKGITPSSLLELCCACAEGLVAAFEVPETNGIIFGKDTEGPDDVDLEGREGEVASHIQRRCAEARKRLDEATKDLTSPCSIEDLTLTPRQAICTILRHSLDCEGAQFKSGLAGDRSLSLLKTKIVVETSLMNLRLAGVTTLHEMALVCESVNIEQKEGSIGVNIIHMMCEEGVHIALGEAILGKMVAESKEKRVSDLSDQEHKIAPEDDELTLQLRTLELCIEQLQIETMATEPPQYQLSLHPLARLELIRALVLACSPQSVKSRGETWSKFVGLPSFTAPFRSVCALACARLLLLSGIIGGEPGTESSECDIDDMATFIHVLSTIPFGKIVEVSVPLVTDSLSGGGSSTALLRDIRTLACGITGSLWDVSRDGTEDPLTVYIPALCRTLTSRSTDDPTYVLDICGLLQKSSRNPVNLTLICELLRGYPIMLQACVDTPYALQNASYVRTMAETVDNRK